MSPLRYGIIGLGFFGEKHAEVAATLPQVHLQAVCTRRVDRLHEIQTRWQVPRARTTAECDQILQAAERVRALLMVGHICRFNPRYALVRERIRRGELGQIVSLYARRNIPAARSATVLEQIGPLLGDGIHDTDLMLWMTQSPIRSVYALTHAPRALPHPDIGWAMYRFESGAIGVIENVWMLPPGTPFRIHEQLEVIGTEGAAYVQGSDLNVTIHTPQGLECPDTIYWPEIHGEIVGALRTEMNYFVECARTGTPPGVVTPREARTAVEVLEAAEQSARTGQPLALPTDGRP
jgi:UDP-N-acetylglucosamine 3-dehydrogenase